MYQRPLMKIAAVILLAASLALSISTPGGATSEELPDRPATKAEIRAAVRRSKLVSVDCDPTIIRDDTHCWVASIPQDITRRSSALIDIYIVRVNTSDSGDPILFLQGGPGLGSTHLAKTFAQTTRDTLLIDVRGTGKSEPKLSCETLSELWPDQVGAETTRTQNVTPAKSRKVFKSCVQELEEAGVDLDLYNTTTTATDIEVIRRLLEIDQFTLHGSSYGTRLALTYMSNYPQRVKAALLESPLPFEVDFFAELANSAYKSIGRVDQYCDDDSACEKSHGSFEESLYEHIETLSEEPRIIETTRPKSYGQLDYLLEDTDLLNIVFSSLYRTRAIEALPRQISKAQWGGYDELVQTYVNMRDPEVFDFSTVLYWSTWCREEIPFHDQSRIRSTLKAIEDEFGSTVAETYSAVFLTDGHKKYCEIVDVAPERPSELQAELASATAAATGSAGAIASAETTLVKPRGDISSDIPVLIFSGGFDPVTPTSWARALHSQLETSALVEFGQQSHGLIGSCAQQIRANFLNTADITVDISCADPDATPDFD